MHYFSYIQRSRRTDNPTASLYHTSLSVFSGTLQSLCPLQGHINKKGQVFINIRIDVLKLALLKAYIPQHYMSRHLYRDAVTGSRPRRTFSVQMHNECLYSIYLLYRRTDRNQIFQISSPENTLSISWGHVKPVVQDKSNHATFIELLGSTMITQISKSVNRLRASKQVVQTVAIYEVFQKTMQSIRRNRLHPELSISVDLSFPIPYNKTVFLSGIDPHHILFS